MRGMLLRVDIVLDQADVMARMKRPRTVVVSYRGMPYELDLVRCRRALVNRQVEGNLDSMESLAQTSGISRSTASRFFSGTATSLTVTLKIAEALHLKFEDVAKSVELPGAASSLANGL
jgi:hypothetical protein